MKKQNKRHDQKHDENVQYSFNLQTDYDNFAGFS